MSEDLEAKFNKLLLLLARAEGRFERGRDDVISVDDGLSLKRTRLSSEFRQRLLTNGLAEITAGAIRLTATGRASAARLHATQEAYRLQHGAIGLAPQDLAAQAAGALIDDAESPLAWLHRRKGGNGLPLVDEAEFRAGERLRLDFTKGGMMPSVTSNWRDMASSGSAGLGGRADLTDAALAARDRVNKALSSIGPELAGVVIDVCCFLKGLETVESDRSWPQRSAKVVLKLALKALARHYGIASEVTANAGNGLVRHWGSDDYRPEISRRSGA